jgi:hypothetical protein
MLKRMHDWNAGNMMHGMSPSQSPTWIASTWPKPLECSDVLCLVQGLLAREQQIILLEDIDVSRNCIAQ